MARERLITPGFYKNAKLAKLPLVTRMLWPGIWTVSDFDGVFLWEPEELAMKLLPREDFDPIQAIDSLEASGFLKSYVVEGSKYGYTVNWHKYQKCHPDEACVYPRPVDDLEFLIRIKPINNRKQRDKNRLEDIAYGLPAVSSGVVNFMGYMENAKTTGSQQVDQCFTPGQPMANSATPSTPSLPPTPTTPTLPAVIDNQLRDNPKEVTSQEFKKESTNESTTEVILPNAEEGETLISYNDKRAFPITLWKTPVYVELDDETVYNDPWATIFTSWQNLRTEFPDKLLPKRIHMDSCRGMTIRLSMDPLWYVKWTAAMYHLSENPEARKNAGLEYLLKDNWRVLDEFAAKGSDTKWTLPFQEVDKTVTYRIFQYIGEVSDRSRPLWEDWICSAPIDPDEPVHPTSGYRFYPDMAPDCYPYRMWGKARAKKKKREGED